jgi:hypothetical protein
LVGELAAAFGGCFRRLAGTFEAALFWWIWVLILASLSSHLAEIEIVSLSLVFFVLHSTKHW